MSTCKGCGKKIVWGETSDGKKIPLDPAPPVYEIYSINIPKPGDVKVRRADREDYMVSHFATCPKANDFSGSKKGGANGG